MNIDKNRRDPDAFKAEAFRLQEENQKLKQTNALLRRQREMFKKSLGLFSTSPLQKCVS